MDKKILLSFGLLLITTLLFSQTTETFETETTGATSFTDNGQGFTILNGPGQINYDIEFFTNGGYNGTSSDNKFIDNSDPGTSENDGSSFSIITTNGADITIKSFYLFVSRFNLQAGVSTILTFTGKRNGLTVFTVVKNSGIIDGANFSPNNGFNFINFATEGGVDNSNTAVDEIIISSTNNGDYMALDAFTWDVTAVCTDPTIPSITASPSNVCPGASSTLTWTGNLNDATIWRIYSGSCAGSLVGSSATNSFTVTPSNASTTYFIRGESGCVTPGSCGAVTVTRGDAVVPSINCPGNQVGAVNASCVFALPNYTGLATAADNCTSSPSVTQAPAPGTTVGTGTTIVTLTATDGSSNTSSCNFNVVVSDNTPPSISCPGNQTENPNASCQFTLPNYTALASASDNCGTPTVSQSPAPGTIVTGNTSITLIATDGNANSANCSFTVVLNDITPPAISCPGNQTENPNASCQFTLPDYTGLASTSDNCAGSPSITQSPLAGSVISGNTTITLTANDGNGNTAQCTFDVLLNDATPPTAVCQNITVFVDGAGNASIIAADLDGGSSDNCGGVSFSASQTSFTCANLGTNPVTVTVEDGSTNTASCNAVVTVVDTISPIIICPGNQTESPNASCQFTLPNYTGLASTSDNCAGSPSITQSPLAGSVISGNTTITLTANDGNGNTAQCIFDVLLNDATPPTAVCQNITVFVDGAGNASVIAADLDGGSSDNCGGVSFSASQTSFTCANLGTNPVTLTVEDGSTNTASCNAVVTIVDTISPVAVCQNITAFLDGAGNTTIMAADIDAGSLDNCSAITLSASTTAFTCTDLGPNNVTLTVTDGSGNTSSCTAVVTIVDTISPVAICQNSNAYLDGSGTAIVFTSDVDGGSTDNCSIAGLSSSPALFNCSNVGPNNVTLTITDGSANTSSCTAVVTVIDTISPVAICQNINVYLDAVGSASIVAADIDGGSSDNCGSVTLSASQTSFSCLDIGFVNVTLTVSDGSSNSATCTAIVTVLDTITSVNNCNGAFVWTGNNSSDWNTPGNWNLNLVPTSMDVVVVPDVSGASGVFPNLTSATSVGDVTVNTGAQLTVSSGAVLVIAAGETFTNNGTVTLEADISGTGILDDFSNLGASFVGNITVQQYISTGSGLGQRLFGSPVDAGIVSGLDPTYTGYPLGQLVVDDCVSETLMSSSPYSNLLQWNENSVATCYLDGWEAIAPGSSLMNGRAYSGWVNDGSLISFTGAPNSGAINYGGLGNSASGISDADGWHLVSNPYPSPVSVSSLQTLNGANFTSYNYYDGGSGPFSGTYQPFLPGDNLAIMQGFVANTASTNTFNFTNSTRTTSNTTFKNGTDWYEAKLDISVTGNAFSDITYLYYNQDATANFDYQWDCAKRMGDHGQPTLYTGIEANKLALNGNNLSDFGHSVPLGLLAGTNGSFELSFDGLSTFPEHTTIYLEDKQTSTFHNITNGNYSFNSSVSDDADRFEIHFVKPVNLQTTAVNCNAENGLLRSIDEVSSRSYELLSNGELIASGSLPDLEERLEEGTYELVVYDQYGGSQLYLVEIDALEFIEANIEVSATEIEVNESITLSNLTSNASNIEWIINNEIIVGQHDLSYTFNQAGTYDVTAHVSNTACSDTHVVTINVSDKTTGFLTIDAHSYIKMYAFQGILNIEFTAVANENLRFRLFNLLGQELMHQQLQNQVKQTIQLPKNINGYHIVKLEIGKAVYTGSLWIKD